MGRLAFIVKIAGLTRVTPLIVGLAAKLFVMDIGEIAVDFDVGVRRPIVIIIETCTIEDIPKYALEYGLGHGVACHLGQHVVRYGFGSDNTVDMDALQPQHFNMCHTPVAACNPEAM